MHPLQPEVREFRADLHTHTMYSDGSFTPYELIDHAVEMGLNALSITDHDTVDAYAEAFPYAKSKGLILVSGVEFSSLYKKQNVHILGYGIDTEHPFLKEFCTSQRDRRKGRNFEILAKLKKVRFPIEENELEALEKIHRTIGRPHIAKLMVDKGYVKTIQEAFSLYLGDGRCCYAQGVSATIDEALNVIKQSSGKALIAHPHLFKDGGIVRELLTHPFDGLECYYGRCSTEKERRFLKIAKTKKLLISGGSDFHGSIKPYLPLGCSWTPKEEFVRIFPSYE
ncbi:MAG: PHP domain-containing protein [Chlamydiae bacterium]|nr:PHP domain-containing protein [Chlamydiota bacterium]